MAPLDSVLQGKRMVVPVVRREVVQFVGHFSHALRLYEVGGYVANVGVPVVGVQCWRVVYLLCCLLVLFVLRLEFLRVIRET